MDYVIFVTQHTLSLLINVARAHFHSHAKRSRVFKCIYGINTAFTLVMMHFIHNNNNNMAWLFAYYCEIGS